MKDYNDVLFEIYEKAYDERLAEECDGDNSIYLTPYGTVTIGEDCLCISVYVSGKDKKTALKEAEKIPEIAVLAKNFPDEAVFYDNTFDIFKKEKHSELQWE